MSMFPAALIDNALDFFASPSKETQSTINQLLNMQQRQDLSSPPPTGNKSLLDLDSNKENLPAPIDVQLQTAPTQPLRFVPHPTGATVTGVGRGRSFINALYPGAPKSPSPAPGCSFVTDGQPGLYDNGSTSSAAICQSLHNQAATQRLLDTEIVHSGINPEPTIEFLASTALNELPPWQQYELAQQLLANLNGQEQPPSGIKPMSEWNGSTRPKTKRSTTKRKTGQENIENSAPKQQKPAPRDENAAPIRNYSRQNQTCWDCKEGFSTKEINTHAKAKIVDLDILFQNRCGSDDPQKLKELMYHLSFNQLLRVLVQTQILTPDNIQTLRHALAIDINLKLKNPRKDLPYIADGDWLSFQEILNKLTFDAAAEVIDIDDETDEPVYISSEQPTTENVRSDVTEPTAEQRTAEIDRKIEDEIQVLEQEPPSTPGPSVLPDWVMKMDLEGTDQQTADPEIEILETTTTDPNNPGPFELPEWMQKILREEDDFKCEDIQTDETADDLEMSLTVFEKIADMERKDNITPLNGRYSPISPTSTPPASRCTSPVDPEFAASALDHQMPKQLCEGAVSNTAEALLLELRTMSEWSNNERDSDESDSDESDSDDSESANDRDSDWEPKKRKRTGSKRNGDRKRRRKN